MDKTIRRYKRKRKLYGVKIKIFTESPSIAHWTIPESKFGSWLFRKLFTIELIDQNTTTTNSNYRLGTIAEARRRAQPKVVSTFQQKDMGND